MKKLLLARVAVDDPLVRGSGQHIFVCPLRMVDHSTQDLSEMYCFIHVHVRVHNS